jgi:amidase
MAANDLDAIVAPTNGPAWLTDPVNGDDLSAFVGSSSPSAIAGYAQITVPAGYVGPLPVGVSFLGGQWDEPALLGFAYAYEQATDVRVPPQFLPTTSATGAKHGKGKGQQADGRAAGDAERRGRASTR